MQAASQGVSGDAQHATEGGGVAWDQQEQEEAERTEQGLDEHQAAVAAERDRPGAPAAAARADEEDYSRDLPPPQQVLHAPKESFPVLVATRPFLSLLPVGWKTPMGVQDVLSYTVLTEEAVQNSMLLCGCHCTFLYMFATP